MNEVRKIAVAIVEDDSIVRIALEDALRADGAMRFSGAFADGGSFLEKVEHLSLDVVIMDLNLQGMSGVECTRKVIEKCPSVLVLVCTKKDDDESLFQALCAGAKGYLLKDTHPAQVVEAVRNVYSGGSPMSPGIARRVLASFSTPRKQSKEFELLTERERQVLDQLANGYRYKEIADRLHMSIDTVRTHVRNLYEKLHVSSRTDALNKLYPRS